MIKSKKLGQLDDYVYDIHLDGTVVNALGNNVLSNTDGFNFQLPKTYRYTKDNPYIGKGLNRNVTKGKEYTGFDADVAEFNDLFMRKFMGLGIDEVVSSTINFSRKNYADYFPENSYPEDVKKVGNSVKSKKMAGFIAKFLDKGIRLLLQKNGAGFLDEYYHYVERIYNYEIPLKDIASKGKVKKSLAAYIEDCKTLTKAGRPKSRQAWMELALRDGIKVDMGDTLYYINTGKSKSQADVKKVVHYYVNVQDMFGEENKKDLRTTFEKEHKKYKKENPQFVNITLDEFVEKFHPEAIKEEEIILNAMLLPREIIDSEEDFYCKDGEEYNVPKYVEMFNKRITGLLVCFKKEIRDKILINNPADRPVFTPEEMELCSGEPNKIGDQDTYEALMAMEDKEIKFWAAHPEFDIPFLEECDMNWDDIYNEYTERKERELELGIDNVRKVYEDVLNNLTVSDIDALEEDGTLPNKLEKIINIDPVTGFFVSKEYPDIVIGNVNDMIDAVYYKNVFDNESDIN
jgi:hypothetical protein